MTASNSLPIAWANVHVATCDDAGNVYVLLSQSEAEWTLASLDRERRLRWNVPAPSRWRYMEDANTVGISAWSDGGALVAEVVLAESSKADHAFAFVGWDGATWVSTYRAKGLLWGENFEGSWPRWRRYDRHGQTLGWSDAYFLLSEADAAWADRDGHAYALWLVGGGFARIMRYATDLKSFEYWLLSSVGPQVEPGTFDPEKLRPTRRTPTAVRSEKVFCVAPDGAIWAFGSLDRLRCFDASGEATYVSPASHAADANGES